MPKTRSMLGQAGQTRDAPAKAKANTAMARRNTGRTALGDVSNRATLRASKAADTNNARPTKSKSYDTQLDGPAQEPKRSLRASTLAQGAETNADCPKTRSKSRGTAIEARKRTRETDAEPARPAKQGRSSSKSTKASASSRGKSATSSKSKGISKPTRRSSRSKSRNLCQDLLYNAGHGLVRAPLDSARYTVGVAAHDQPILRDELDVLEVPSYVTDIFQRLYNAETKTRPKQYMHEQEEINAMMRAILVDWLVEVHMKFRLVPQTLYLCVNIIDRYCSIVQVKRKRLQLVGVTALLIACKYEEIYPPEVRDCVYITDRTYTRQEVLDMEQDIVKILNFHLTVPHGHNFLVRFLRITKASEIAKFAASYYMERMLQEYAFLKYRPSLVAAASVCLALNNSEVLSSGGDYSNKRPGIPQALLDYSGFRVSNIKDCAEEIIEKVSEDVVTASHRELVAAKRKFDCSKYAHVSTLVRPPRFSDLKYL